MKIRSKDERIRKKINKKIDNCKPKKENVKKLLINKIKCEIFETLTWNNKTR